MLQNPIKDKTADLNEIQYMTKKSGQFLTSITREIKQLYEIVGLIEKQYMKKKFKKMKIIKKK